MARRRGSAIPFPSREAILEFVEQNPDRVSRREIARAFNLDADQRPELRRVLGEMIDEGVIDRSLGRTVAARGDLPAVSVIEITGTDEDGDVLAKPLAWRQEVAPPTIYLAPDRRRGPAPGPGDRILARLTRRGPDTYEAQIMRHLSAGPAAVLGIYQVVRGEGRIRPVDKRARHELFVASEDAAGAQPGELVRGEVLRGRRLGLNRARVVERLETESKRSLSLIALYDHEIPIEFPDEALEQAQAAGPAKLETREDLREIPLVTIDGADARDFDDAVWAEPDAESGNPGGWHLLVAIADVAWYVRPGDALDRAAYQRGNSVYFPDRVVPMLPEELSNGWCSLKPDEDRPCLAVHLWIDSQGRPLRHKFVRGLMRSTARLTYSQVQAAHDGNSDDLTRPLWEAVIKPLYGAFEALETARRARGVLELDLPERKVEVDGSGRVTRIAVAPRYDSHRLIEEFMIAANVAAADELTKRKSPCMFRIHDSPSVEKLEALREVLDGIGLKLPRGQVVKPADFNRILEKIAGRDEAPLVSEMVLRTQAQAEYSPDNIGHFGLALRRYCHFTSPIRRYSDLLVHRALIAKLRLGEGALMDDGPDFIVAGEHISATERRAAAAERDAVDRFTAEWLSQQGETVFSGRIAGVSRAGLFVRLDSCGADGLIPKRFLPSDTYTHDEKRQCLRGRRTRREFRLGDSVEVMLAEATPVTGGIILHLLDAGNPSRWRAKRKRQR